MLSIAILCGGKSRRFGEDKWLYSVNGRRMFEIVYEKFREKSNDIFLQVSKENFQKLETSIEQEVDIVVRTGPMGGIYSALCHAKYENVFVVASDLIFVDPNILDVMRQHADADCVVPRWKNGFCEPLCAVYSKRMSPLFEAEIGKRNLKISSSLIKAKNVKWLEIEPLIEKKMISRNCFRNINSMEDLKKS